MQSDVTRILSAIDAGDARASEELLPLVYEELRRLAGARLARERAGHTLQPTELVHEAYLRLLGPEDPGPEPCLRRTSGGISGMSRLSRGRRGRLTG